MKAKQFRKRLRNEPDEDDDTSVVRPSVGKKPVNVFATTSRLPEKQNVLAATAIPSDRAATAYEYGGDAFATRDVDGPRGRVQGPIRAPTNVRGICRIDYQPDVCKDYKETGYCGFGDSCIYLHDRGDYKSGWQIEKEWQEQQRKKQESLAAKLAAGGTIDDDDESDATNSFAIKDNNEEDDLPFACYICRGKFVNPISTQCGHYFCEFCAAQRYLKDPTCAVCQKPTYGIFSAAPKLAARIDALRERSDTAPAVECKQQYITTLTSEEAEEHKTGTHESGWTTVES